MSGFNFNNRQECETESKALASTGIYTTENVPVKHCLCTRLRHVKLLSVSDKFLPLHLQERSLNQKGQLRSIVEGFAMRAERPDSRRMGVELAGDGPTASAIVTQANIHSMHSPDIEDLAGGLLVTISITSRDRTRAC